MRYAETGFNLEIDLSRGSIERVGTDPRLTELHLGGQGTAAKILWDRVGPDLKHAGYDKIVGRGKSPDLVYLWIHNDKVEIRDASHLQGKGALETAALIQEELYEPKAQVAAIGLAGENRVYMASIEHANSSASRGVGSVMGDKKLKAIAVRGTKDVKVTRP